MKTLKTLLSDPCVFFHAMTGGYKPHAYQRWILNHSVKDGARMCILLPRKSGKTLVLSVLLLFHALTTKERDFSATIMSPSEDQSALMYEPIREMLFHPVLQTYLKAYLDKTGRKLMFNRKRIQVPSNFGKSVATIRLLSGDMSGKMAGRQKVGIKTSILCVDESSLVDELYYKKMRPSRELGEYRCEILSGTPRQTSGFYYNACRPPKDNWQYNIEYKSALGYDVIHRDWTEISHKYDNPKVRAEVEADMKASDPEDNETEQMAHFVADFGKFFDRKSVELCMSKDQIPNWTEWIGKTNSQNHIIAALDLAIEADESYLLYFYTTGHNHLTLIHAESYKRKPDVGSDTRPVKEKSDIVQHMKIMKQHGLQPTRVYVDISRDESVQSMLEDNGFRVEGVRWSPTVKQSLMFYARDCLRAGQLTLPPVTQSYHANTLHSQIRRYSYHISEAGNYIWNVRTDTTQRRKHFSDDALSALAMGCQWLGQYRQVKSVAATLHNRGNKSWDFSTYSSQEKKLIASLSL